MKNIFSYTPPQKSKGFKISKSPYTPTLSKDIEIKKTLIENKKLISQFTHADKTNDVKLREVSLSIDNTPYSSLLVFYDGLCNSEIINNYIIRELQKNIDNEKSSFLKSQKSNTPDFSTLIPKRILSDSDVKEIKTFGKAIDALLSGDSVLFIDNVNTAFVCDSKKLPGRSISKAEIEMNLQGPNEAFIENFRTNTSLIRKFIKDENLIFETVEVGTESKTKCALTYISSIANDSLVEEVKTRLNGISIDYLLDSGQLEQLIEDKTYIISPLILSTERPDKVASHLIEGRIAIIVDGSPNVLIVPAIFSDFIHPAEDSYVRFPYSLLLRIFRLPAIIISVFLPGLYISICNFHQELILTDLLFAIARHTRKSTFYYANRTFNYGNSFRNNS
ncbi:MAG: spore germination protein [Clostridia bacterium]|nr:spore germination protein [Clostridia bacterium]